MGDAEAQALLEALRSGLLTQGPRVAHLEATMCELTGTQHAVAVNSGTAAIHTALTCLGIRSGDVVLTTPFSFIGSLSPVLMLGGRLRFVDIDPSDFCLDNAQAISALDDIAAVIAVDLYGQMSVSPELRDACAARGVPILEDACQAIGATRDGIAAGAAGDVGCFSLYATKNVMCGEGGLLVTNREDVAQRARRFRQHGMSGPYEYDGLGWNYRMTDLAAAIASVQLARLDEISAARRANAAFLRAGLADIEELVLPRELPGRRHVWHQFTVRVRPGTVGRDDVVARLAEQGIRAGVYYPAVLSEVPHVRAATVADCDLTQARAAADEVLSVPVHPSLTEHDLTRVVDAMHKAVR